MKRVSLVAISKHLKEICTIEKGNVTDQALNIISRASEGSVRDAVSLLDRTLIHQSLKPDQTIDAKEVRDMLGLVDKSKLINLLGFVFKGDQKNTLKVFKEIFDDVTKFIIDEKGEEIISDYEPKENGSSESKEDDKKEDDSKGDTDSNTFTNIEFEDI